MQRSLKHGLSLFFSALLCFGMIAALPYGECVADADRDYYASVTAAGGEEMLGQIHDLITSTHTTYTTYADCKNPDYVKRTDPGPNGQLLEFYAQAELSSEWRSGSNGTWNREHVWCKSLSNGFWGEAGGGSDLLHIRPTESRLNNSRGNNKYGIVDGGNEAWYRNERDEKVAPGGYVGGGVFEPLDSVKGDVARIILYLYTHYNTYANVHGTTNGSGASYYFGTLKFSFVISAKSESDAIGLLLEWHRSDPVASIELERNEAAFEIQGNRNPFVDHPEYAEAIWGSSAGGQGGQEGGTALEAFGAAVKALVKTGTPEARRSSLVRAITAYRALSEKEKITAAEDIEELEREIKAYNEAVGAYNAEGARQNYGALAGAGGLLDGGGE